MPTRMHELDGLRGLAALGVVVFHFPVHYGAAPWPLPLAPFYARGYFLVDLFFVLSGYLMAELAARGHYASPRAAVWARIRRLYPLHLITLALTIPIALAYRAAVGRWFMDGADDVLHIAINALMLQGFTTQAGLSWNRPAWSVGVELWVSAAYLVVAVRGRRALPALALLGLALLPGLPDYVTRCAGGFAVGALLREASARLRPSVAWDVLAILGAVLFWAIMRDAPWGPLATVASAIVVLGVRQGRAVPRLLSTRPLRWLGARSFALYLAHYPVQIWMGLAILGQGWDLASPALLATFVAASLGAAVLLRRWG